MTVVGINSESFAPQGVDFHPDWSNEECQQRLDVCKALAVPEKLANTIAFTLQLYVVDGRPSVAASAKTLLDFWDLFTSCLLTLWRFRVWSEGRFLNAGIQSRVLTIACMTGMEDLVAYIEEQCVESMFYLNGVKRLNDDVRVVIVICGVVIRVVEPCMRMLMKDSRVVSLYDSLWQSMADAVFWAISLPSHVWSALAEVANADAAYIRSQCIASAHICFHFFGRRVLLPVGQIPWCLARGNIDSNVDEPAVESDVSPICI